MAAGMILMGIALAISGLLSPSLFYVFVVLACLVGLAGPLFSGPFYAFIQTEIEPQILGRAFGFVTSLSLLAVPIGYVVAGILIKLVGVAALFSIIGVLITINGILALKSK